MFGSGWGHNGGKDKVKEKNKERSDVLTAEALVDRLSPVPTVYRERMMLSVAFY